MSVRAQDNVCAYRCFEAVTSSLLVAAYEIASYEARPFQLSPYFLKDSVWFECAIFYLRYHAIDRVLLVRWHQRKAKCMHSICRPVVREIIGLEV